MIQLLLDEEWTNKGLPEYGIFWRKGDEMIEMIHSRFLTELLERKVRNNCQYANFICKVSPLLDIKIKMLFRWNNAKQDWQELRKMP